MTGFARGRFAWPDMVIILLTLVLAIAAVRWADRKFLATEGPTMASAPRSVARPDWVWAIYGPYRRLQHDYFWLTVTATLGIAALVAHERQTWTRRGLSRPGTVMVAVTLLIGGATVVHALLVGPNFSQNLDLSYSLLNVLMYRVPGAILGAWLVIRLGRKQRRVPDWRERLARLVGWIWMANVGLLIGYGVLFG